MGRPNHHTKRIDANPPRYRTCDSHRIRLAQRLLNPSRAFFSTSPLKSSIKLAFPRRYEIGGCFLRLSYVSAWLRPEPRRHSGGRVRVGMPTTETKRLRLAKPAGSESLLFSLGLDIDGESIDRSSSPISLTNIRYNFTSRHGKKKKKSFARLAFLR